MNIIKRSVRDYLRYWIVILLGLVGVSFLCASGYLALALVVPLPVAALVVGVVALVAAFIAHRVLIAPGRQAAEASEQPAPQEAVAQFARDNAGRIPAEIERRPEAAMAVALGAGLLLGFSPRARSLLGSALKQGVQTLADEAGKQR